MTAARRRRPFAFAAAVAGLLVACIGIGVSLHMLLGLPVWAAEGLASLVTLPLVDLAWSRWL